MSSRQHAVGFEIPNLREERAPEVALNPPEVVEVVLAPFSGTPKLAFEEVQIGASAKQTVNLRNPTDSKAKVILVLPKDMTEQGLAVSSMEFEIAPRGKETLEITFQPAKIVSSHHTVKVVDCVSRRQKGQFQITCVSVVPKKQCGKKRKVWDKQPHLPVFGFDRPPSISVKPPATWAHSGLAKPFGDCAALNPPDDTTFTLSPAANPINATYVCPKPVEAKEASPSFDDSLENLQPVQPSSEPAVWLPANTSKTQRYLDFGSEGMEKENHISPKKHRTANVSFSDIGFDSLTPDHPVGTRAVLKSKENVKNVSFSTLNFSPALTPMAKKGVPEEPVSVAPREEEDKLANVRIKQEPISPRVPEKNVVGPLMTPNFKAPLIRPDTENMVSACFVKPEPVTPVQPMARVESFSPGRSVARVEPLTPRQQVAKIEPLLLSSSRFVSKVEALTPVAPSSKPLLAFEMSPPTRNPVFVRKELFGRPHVTSTPMETSNGKQRKLQRKHLSPKSLTSFKKKNVRVYMAPPTPSRPSSTKAGVPAEPDPPEDPAHTFYKQPLYNVDIYGTTTMSDPFARTAIHPLEYQDRQAMELIKWVNSVLTLPEEYSEVDVGVDVVALWKKSNASDTLTLPASRETVCSKYHKNELHLYNLRKSAHLIFQSKDMTDTLYQVHAKIDTGFISVKDDIDLHSDQGVRCHLVQLLMHYNPLWLRIGLEAIYGRNIPVQPKRPSLDLIIFIKNNFLSDKYIIERNSYNNVHHYRMPKFRKEMNDYIIFKYLSLIFFLDVAKKSCIIPYDPCLFRKESPIKESEGMLNEFIKEFIKCVSHMKKTLASWGYTLTHKQTAIDEYDFAVHSHLDLRDGASLTRLIEVILRKKYLIQKLRLPAISRLQKMHNVKVAFAALEEEKVQLVDVEPKDVVDAHKEKIMSLLWQILNKFLKPRLENAAIVIQTWWQKQSLKLEITRRIRTKEEKKKDAAAARIQALWRGYRLRKGFPEIKEKLIEEKAVYLKRLEELAKQAKSQKVLESVAVIQRWFRATRLMWKERAEYVAKRNAAITVQEWYRATCRMKKDKSEFQSMRRAAIRIQEWYRACVLARKQRADYQKMLAKHRENLARSNAALKIQQWYRVTVLMRNQRSHYMKQLCAAKKVQQWYRATSTMKKDRKTYLVKLDAVVKIQQWFRASALMKKERAKFEAMQKAAIKIQQWYRATAQMKKEHKKFKSKCMAAVKVQIWYRSVLQMRKEKTKFQTKKTAVIRIQQWYKATAQMKKERKEFESKRMAAVKVQIWYRSILHMRKERGAFLAKKTAAVKIQQWYLATAQMKKERKEFESKRAAAVKVQIWYRSILQLRKEKAKFQTKKTAVIRIQQWYRATAQMKKERKEFESKRMAAVEVQIWYRSILYMRKERGAFHAKKTAAIKIQRWYRAAAQMKKELKDFEAKRSAAVKVQIWYRSILFMRKEKAKFQTKKTAVTRIQQWYRATAQMKKERKEFESKRMAAVKAQIWYRSVLHMRKERGAFHAKKSAAIKIQQWYRTTAQMTKEREHFRSQRAAAIKLQMWYRSILHMRKERGTFCAKKTAAIKVQQWYRATAQMKKELQDFKSTRAAAIKLQVWYRSILLMRKEKAQFQTKKSASIKIQLWFRVTVQMKKERKEFELKQAAAIKLQSWYRSVLVMRKQHDEFQAKRKAAVKIQRWFKATTQMKEVRQDYQSKRSAALRIQQYYRATVLMRKDRQAFMLKCSAATKIQQWFRATALMIKERAEFNAKCNAAIKIQRKFRATALMKKERAAFVVKRSAVLKMQQWYRAIAAVKKLRADVLAQRYAVKTIEEWYRSFILMRKDRAEYLAQRNATIMIQQRYKATVLMKKERQEFIIKRDLLRALASVREGQSCDKPNPEKVSKVVQWWYSQFRTDPMQQSFEVLHNELVKRCRQEAAWKILRWYRRAILTRETRLDFVKMKLAAIRIQVWYKNIIYVRRETRLRALKNAAQNANEWIKLVDLMRLEREAYARKRESDVAARSAMQQALAVEIEQALKDTCRRQLIPSPTDSELLSSNAKEPERSAENAAALASHIAAAKLIQDWYRSVQLKRQVRAYFLLRRDAVIKIQRSYRAYRKRVAEALAARANGEEVKPKQPSIGQNYENAIAVILNGNSSFHHLFVSFKNIDFALRHSTGLCEKMVQSENSYEIVRAIYHYLSAENRSNFYQTVFDVAMSVILEAISYEVTYDAVWEHTKTCGGIVIILQFLGKFLEKGEPLFCKAATILWAFTRTPQQIKEILSTTDCKQRLSYYRKKASSKTVPNAGHQRHALKPIVLPTLKRNGGYPTKPTKRYFSTRIEALTVLDKTFS